MSKLRNTISVGLSAAIAIASLSVIASAPAASELAARGSPLVSDMLGTRIQSVERPTALSLPRSVGVRTDLARTRDGRVRVVVESSNPAAAKAAAESLGGRVERTWRNLVQVVVPARNLRKLARRDSVTEARAPFTMVEDVIPGEGVAASLASAWHAAGLTGQGVKVAVIDGASEASPSGRPKASCRQMS
jgi:hypothetical protein